MLLSQKNKNKTALIVELILFSLLCFFQLRWLLDNVPAVSEAASQGRLVFGTVDTWLIWNLTKEHRHITDVTNASR